MKDTLIRGRQPKDPRQFDLVDFAINDAVASKMYKALMVITSNPDIENALYSMDPKALQQCNDAVMDYLASYQDSDL